jgi:hypothetical protein
MFTSHNRMQTVKVAIWLLIFNVKENMKGRGEKIWKLLKNVILWQKWFVTLNPAIWETGTKQRSEHVLVLLSKYIKSLEQSPS